MPISRRAHPAKRTRQAVGAASGVTYLAVTAVIGVSVRSQAEAAETASPPVDETIPPSTAPETLAFAGAAAPAPALPVFPEMTAIDGVPTSLPDEEPADALVEPTLAPSTTQAPTTSTAAPTTTAQVSTSSTATTVTSAAPPTTGSDTTAAPTTSPPTTAAPTTQPPTTAPPTTPAPTTSAPPTTPTTDAS